MNFENSLESLLNGYKWKLEGYLEFLKQLGSLTGLFVEKESQKAFMQV